jgi:hypothetical protein
MDENETWVDFTYIDRGVYLQDIAVLMSRTKEGGRRDEILWLPTKKMPKNTEEYLDEEKMSF